MNKFFMNFIVGLTLSISSPLVHALTDEEAIAEGMTPIEEYLEDSSDKFSFSTFMNDLRRGVSIDAVSSETGNRITMLQNNRPSKVKSSSGPTLSDVEEAIRSHRLVIAVNKASKGSDAQTLVMYENGVEVFRDKVSTGREKEEKSVSGRVYFSTTPKGFFRPTKIYRDYLSYTWNAPMPNAVFIVGGIALHATGESYYKNLGTRASGGCVRLTLEASKLIRSKVMDTGRGSEEGQYKVVNEAKGRNRIANNSVSVDQISRNNGRIINEKVTSWDTVVVVYEN